MSALDPFVAEVRTYCDFMHRAAAMSLAERLSAARERLLALYTAALLLPVNPEAGDFHAGSNHERPPDWQGFEEKEHYWEVFDPYELTEPVCGSLSDDLLDVYYDVQRGLALWDGGHAREAIWEWRFHFEIHWGDHAIDALRALHRACNPNR